MPNTFDNLLRSKVKSRNVEVHKRIQEIPTYCQPSFKCTLHDTSRSLKERLKEHEADTRHHRSKPVAEHFNSGQHSVEDMGYGRIIGDTRFLPSATHQRDSAQRVNYFRHRDTPWNTVERTISSDGSWVDSGSNSDLTVVGKPVCDNLFWAGFWAKGSVEQCLQTKCGRTDSGQRPILKPHLSNQCSITRKTAPPPGSHFRDDWAKIVTSRVKLPPPPPGNHVIQLTGTIFQLNSRIKETNVLTKFHENWAKYVTSRKNAPPTGGHVFSPISTIFELVRHINKSNVLINSHDDWAKIVTSRVFTRKTAPPTGGHVFQHSEPLLNSTNISLRQTFRQSYMKIRHSIFELERDNIGTNLLTKFHEDRPINVASRVFTNKSGRTTDGRRTKTTKVLTKFHENLAKNVTSRVLTCFHYIHIDQFTPVSNAFDYQCIAHARKSGIKTITMNWPIEKNAPPTGSHVFTPIWTIFELVRHINKTNVLTNFHDDWHG
ncbi:hypothetical protein DPMN_164939 [Dreissena polymorpha]|uniref:Uncharacterized protein n=1 Tax=Dreissena polymorpha TaxID=45954 RepID=A0A9D4EZN9_DREPO|nr:hypothetical protein DPMN_164939 [Dreissena polymorpha]